MDHSLLFAVDAWPPHNGARRAGRPNLFATFEGTRGSGLGRPLDDLYRPLADATQGVLEFVSSIAFIRRSNGASQLARLRCPLFECFIPPDLKRQQSVAGPRAWEPGRAPAGRPFLSS